MAERNYTFREEKKIKDVEEVFVDNTKPLPIQTSVVETPATEIPTDGTNVTLVRQAFDKDVGISVAGVSTKEVCIGRGFVLSTKTS